MVEEVEGFVDSVRANELIIDSVSLFTVVVKRDAADMLIRDVEDKELVKA
jgi:hypothetical protein